MKKDRILSISIIIVFTSLYLETFKFKEKTSTQIVGPATYPRFIIYIIIFFAIIILIRSFRSKQKETQSLPFNLNVFLNKYKKIVLLFLFFGVFVFLFSKLGFIFASAFFLFFSQALLMEFKISNIGVNISITFIATFFTYFIFTNFLGIIFP